MNTRSGRRYVRHYDRNAQVPENPTTSEDPIEKERKSFIYDFIDHLSRVPIKVSLIDLLKLDKRRREMLTAVLASVEKEEGRNYGVISLANSRSDKRVGVSLDIGSSWCAYHIHERRYANRRRQTQPSTILHRIHS